MPIKLSWVIGLFGEVSKVNSEKDLGSGKTYKPFTKSSGADKYLGVVNLLTNKNKTDAINKIINNREIFIFVGILDKVMVH